MDNPTVRQRLQVEWCCISSAPVRDPSPSCKESAGQFILYYLLSPKWVRGMDRLGGRVSTQSAAAAPGPGSELVQGQFWRGDTPGLGFFEPLAGLY